MDLVSVSSWRSADRRADLRLAEGEAFVAGGSWIFSEPQPEIRGLVDLQTMGWEPWRATDDGLSIAATCTIAELVAVPARWPGQWVIRACAEAFLMSFKVWNTATVGGNLCLALPAGAMISLTSALDAQVVIWSGEDAERRVPVLDLVRGPGVTVLRQGEVIRSVEVPAAALSAPVAFRRIALSELGRSASLVIGRRDGDLVAITVTAATTRPVRLLLPVDATPGQVTAAVEGIDHWYDDPHGDPRWRAGVTAGFVHEIVEELS